MNTRIKELAEQATRDVPGDLQQEAADGLETLMNAVAAEREACAKLCEETDDGTPYNLAQECAAIIRARDKHD